MKAILRYIFLAVCLSSYCFFVFSASYISPSNSDVLGKCQSEKIHPSELSKIVFPQSINTEIDNFSSMQIKSEGEQSISEAFSSIQYLSKFTCQLDVNYLKSAKYWELQFPIVDLIYPFHDFW